MDIIKTKPGFTTASKKPSRKRFVAIPAKFVHAGVVIRIMPHITVVVPMTLPKGSLWMT